MRAGKAASPRKEPPVSGLHQKYIPEKAQDQSCYQRHKIILCRKEVEKNQKYHKKRFRQKSPVVIIPAVNEMQTADAKEQNQKNYSQYHTSPNQEQNT